jgi:hypothetical protein
MTVEKEIQQAKDELWEAMGTLQSHHFMWIIDAALRGFREKCAEQETRLACLRLGLPHAPRSWEESKKSDAQRADDIVNWHRQYTDIVIVLERAKRFLSLVEARSFAEGMVAFFRAQRRGE